MSKTLQAVKLRNDFYRDNFRRMVIIMILSFLLNIILLVALYFTNTRPVQVIYFAVTEQGNLIRMQPLSSPVLGPAQLQSWVTENVPKVYALDYIHFRDQLRDIQQYFTSYGWNQFVPAFQPTLDKIVSGQYVASAAVTDVPYIVGMKIINGVMTWKIQVPLKITFRNGDQASTENVIWQIVVQRVNNADSNQLVGISQVVQTVGGQ